MTIQVIDKRALDAIWSAVAGSDFLMRSLLRAAGYRNVLPPRWHKQVLRAGFIQGPTHGEKQFHGFHQAVLLLRRRGGRGFGFLNVPLDPDLRYFLEGLADDGVILYRSLERAQRFCDDVIDGCGDDRRVCG